MSIMNTETRNIVIGAILVILVVLAVIFIGKNRANAPTDTTDGANVPEDWQDFESGTYNSTEDMSTVYTVSYPKDFVLSKKATARGGFLGNPLVTMAFPDGSFATPKSNFSEGYATVSSNKSKNTESKCFAKPAEATGEFVDVDTNTTMKRIDASDAGAGNLYTSRIYRTLYDNVCYEVALTVHTTNVDNYDPGTVVEFDKEQAFAILETIRNSFKLRTEAGPLK